MRRSCWAFILLVSLVAVPAVHGAKKKTDGQRGVAMQLYKDAKAALQTSWDEERIDYSKAEGLLQKSIDVDPSFTQAYLLLGSVFEEQQEWGKAIRVYRDASRNSFDKEKGFVSMGRVYAQTGDARNARKILGSVIKRNPYNTEAKNSLAAMLRRSGDLQGAEKLLLSALQHSADDVSTFRELALVRLQTGKTKAARLALLKASKIKPNDAAIQNIYGLLHLKENDEQAAVDAFKSAIELDRRMVAPRLNLSAIYLKHAYYEKALVDLKNVLKLRPRDPVVHSSLGVAYRGIKEFRQAESHFKMALDFDKNHQPARYNLGILYYKYLGSPDKAAAYFEDYRGGTMKVGATDASKSSAPKVFLQRIEQAENKKEAFESWHQKTQDAVNAYYAARSRRLEEEKGLGQVEEEFFKVAEERRKIETDIAAIDDDVQKRRSRREKIDVDLTNKASALNGLREKLASSVGTTAAAAGNVSEQINARKKSAQELDQLADQVNGLQKKVLRQEAQLRRLVAKIGERASKNDLLAGFEKASNNRLAQVKGFARADRALERLDRDYQRILERHQRLQADFVDLKKRHQEASDTFASAAKNLVKIADKLDGFYKEAKLAQDNRAKLEQELASVINQRRNLEKGRSTQEEELRDILADARKAEEELFKLDRIREAKGTRLRQLEDKRRSILKDLSDYGALVADLGEGLSAIENQRQANEKRHADLVAKLGTLEQQRSQIEKQVAGLLDQRKKAREQVAQALERKQAVAQQMAKIDRQRMDILSGLVTGGDQRKKAVQEEKRVFEKWTDIDNALASRAERLAVKESFSKSQQKNSAELIKEYDALFAEAQQQHKQFAEMLQKEQSLFAAIRQGETNVRKDTAKTAELIEAQKALVTQWDGDRKTMAELFGSRSSEEKDILKLQEQRAQLERQRDQAAQHWNQRVAERIAINAKRQELLRQEVVLYNKVVAADRERRETASRDLLTKVDAAKAPKKGKK